MSNPKTDVKNPNSVNGDNGGTIDAPAKKNIFVRAYDGGQKLLIRIKSTKGGRAVIRVGKFAIAGLGVYEAYKLGQHSVKPTTVYITEGVTEEEEAPEENPEEKKEEEQEAD